MRVSFVLLLLVSTFLALAVGEEAITEKRKSVLNRITAPIGGLYNRAKNVIGRCRRSMGSKAKKSANEATGQKSKLEEGVGAVMDELAAEGDPSVHAAQDATSKAAAAVKDTVAMGAKNLAGAGESIERAVEGTKEKVSKEADAAVEGMANAGNEEENAAKESKAAMAEQLEAAFAGGEL